MGTDKMTVGGGALKDREEYSNIFKNKKKLKPFKCMKCQDKGYTEEIKHGVCKQISCQCINSRMATAKERQEIDTKEEQTKINMQQTAY